MIRPRMTLVLTKNLSVNLLPFRALDQFPWLTRRLQAMCQELRGSKRPRLSEQNHVRVLVQPYAGLTWRLHHATGLKVCSILSTKHAALWAAAKTVKGGEVEDKWCVGNRGMWSICVGGWGEMHVAKCKKNPSWGREWWQVSKSSCKEGGENLHWTVRVAGAAWRNMVLLLPHASINNVWNVSALWNGKYLTDLCIINIVKVAL